MDDSNKNMKIKKNKSTKNNTIENDNELEKIENELNQITNEIADKTDKNQTIKTTKIKRSKKITQSDNDSNNETNKIINETKKVNKSKKNNDKELENSEIESDDKKIQKGGEENIVKTPISKKIENNKNTDDKIIKKDMINIANGDCMNVMKNIKDKSIDMILCDLPYGMTKNKWDIVIPFDKLWLEYNRIIKDNGCIALFGNQPFTSLMISSNYKNFRYELIWEKNKFSDFLNAKRKPMKTHENICIFYKKQPTYNPQYWYGDPYKRWNKQESVDKQTNYGNHKENIAESIDGKRLPTTILKFNRIERPEHPTQKPVDLLEWLIKTYTNVGEIVLDNCMGVGSTGEACINTNRKFYGIEKDDKYFKIANDKLYKLIE
jgi:site-specific DNA-methyltransferase (adenine-specific)